MKFYNWHEQEGIVTNFVKLLKEHKGLPNLNYLQIGVYTGDASLWLMRNILSDETSRLTDVDIWDLVHPDDCPLFDQDWVDVETFYNRQVFPYKHRINKHKSFSKNWLLANRSEQYDFIYIDGDHTPKAFMTDALLSWDLLKVGGIMAIDDYEWTHPMGEHLNPRPAIDSFIEMHKDTSEVLIKNWQVWLKKTKE
jgi:predicted O-methyltransferase YrrM